MKKLLLLSLGILLLCVTEALAQTSTVTGTVKGKDDGLPLPGVTVVVKGTTKGTQTNTDGKFSLSNVPVGATLSFSFIGYQTLQLPAVTAPMNVVLAPSSSELKEVVVTSLGITAEKRTLGYSQTTVKSDVINKSSPIDLLGGIQGKVAGVTVSEVSGTPGGSTKVILRGFSSIGQSNQPLYVIDGVPLDNTRPTFSNDYDFGNNANDVDPNNVESMSILKGSEATALYGTRGSSGVILITTKKGKAGKPRIDVAIGATMTTPAITYTPQSEFGQGWFGTFILTENGDWGPKYDGVTRPWGAIVDNTQLIKPFSFISNNISNVYDNGLEFNNHIGISGGSENTTYNIAYGNVYSNGILPGQFDTFKKNTFTLSGHTIYKNLDIGATLNFTNRTGNVPQTGDGNATTQGSGFYGALLQIPSDIPLKDLRNYKNTYFNVDNYFTPYAENPFYDLAENGSNYTTDHTFGNVNINYSFTKWFKLNFQQSMDVSSTRSKIWSNVNKPSPGSWNDGNNVEGAQRVADVGSDTEQAFDTFEYDSKLQGLFDKKINNDFHITGLLGVNYNDRGNHTLATSITGLAIPGFFQISNTTNKPVSAEVDQHRRLIAGYGQATLGYKDYLFLTVTGRNDITSTLSPGNNSYFYPSASLAYVISEALGIKGDWLSYAKLRGAYGKTGSDTGPYQTLNTLSPTNINLGFGNLLFPINGVAGYSVNNTLFNSNLKPESITEGEVGGEFRFLNDRISLDVSWYNRVRKDQILAVPIAPTSGYTSEVENFGTVRNRGWEVTIGGTPVKSKNVLWNITYTFSADRSLVESLPDGLNKVILNSAYDANLVAIVGQPLGVFQAPVGVYENGHIVVDNTGLPITAPENGNYGNIQPQFHMGLSNNIRVGDFQLTFTWDYQQGGKFYSGTADLLNFVGADPQTTYNDRNPFIVPNSVQAVTVNGKTTYVENTTQISGQNFYEYWYPTTNKALSYNQRFLTKTYIKLREVTFGYSLPKSVAAKVAAQSATISVFGRNLYTWLPESNRIVDPEVSNQGTDLASEFGEFRTAPPVRFFGASLKCTF
ncbi:MAG TPA: SusC/RagA family TonB-linked outer membrane protein [Mucilaginibacter sp.]|jgi:TonB-linked SusC/RagA family outer membrane protein